MVQFDVDFCRLCPRRDSCHYKGCIFDEKKKDLKGDEKAYFILCEIIERDHAILEGLNAGSKKKRQKTL